MEEDESAARVILLPHEHTLFCERKQRVCSAVGQMQELEILEVQNLPENVKSWAWVRELVKEGAESPNSQERHWFVIDGSEKQMRYQLQLADVGHHLSVRYETCDDLADTKENKEEVDEDSLREKIHSELSVSDIAVAPVPSETSREDTVCKEEPVVRDMIISASVAASEQNTVDIDKSDNSTANLDAISEESGKAALSAPVEEPATTTARASAVANSAANAIVLNALGPVVPGPPRLVNFDVTGNLVPGDIAIASSDYIGGHEGNSEYWWLRVDSEGRRSNLSEATVCTQDSVRELDEVLASGTKSAEVFEKLKNISKVYLIRPEDIGCILKAKCRPVRSDGHKGEIFTSRPSDEIAAARCAAPSTATVPATSTIVEATPIGDASSS